MDFYTQAARGQWEIMRKSRANAVVVADPASSEQLKKRLAQVEEMRGFASEHLDLPGHAAYGRYAALEREHLVWVLYAAPEFSLQPKTWFYPFVGALDYRGYFEEAAARKIAAGLRRDGYDVHVGAVDAYSTLGHFHDPLLDTFLFDPEIHLAETIFHELTHHRVFVAGGTEYNECLANVVAEEGVKRWLAHHGRQTELRRYRQLLERRAEFYAQIEETRGKLAGLYRLSTSPAEMRKRKAEILADLRDRFRELYRKWGARKIEGWMEGDLNNGHIVSLKLYNAQMPELRALFHKSGGDFRKFFPAVDPHRSGPRRPAIRR